MISSTVEIIREMHNMSQGALILLFACEEYGDYFAASKSDISWFKADGTAQVYEQATFAIEDVEESADKSAPEIMLHFSNLGGFAESRIRENDEYQESWVDVYFVNSKLLTLTDPVYHIKLQVQKVSCTRDVATFTIGLDSPLLQLFPSNKFHDSICQYKPYETDICDKAVVCGKLLSDCIAWGNDSNGNPYTERLGMQPGLMGAIQDEDEL